MFEPANERPPDPVLARIAPRWGASRTEQNLETTLARIARHRRVRRAASLATLAAAGAAAAVLAGARLAVQRPPPPVVAQAPHAAPSPSVPPATPSDARLIRARAPRSPGLRPTRSRCD